MQNSTPLWLTYFLLFTHTPFYTHHDYALHCVQCLLIHSYKIYIFLSRQQAHQTLVCAEVHRAVFLSISFQAVCAEWTDPCSKPYLLYFYYTYAVSWSTYFPSTLWLMTIFSASVLNSSAIKELLVINAWSERRCKSASTRQTQLTTCTYHSAFSLQFLPPISIPSLCHFIFVFVLNQRDGPRV